MRERPILMNGESVRATLEGRKTQMRWEITPQPVLGRPWKNWIVDPDWMDLPFAYCPYGIPRDRLWVREAFSYITLAENEFVGEGDQRRRPDGVPVLLLYKADADAVELRGAIAQGMEMLEGAALLAVLWVVVALGGGGDKVRG